MQVHDKPTCCVCRKIFSTLKTLKRHEHLHTQTKQRLSCDVCGKTFARTDNLDIHKRSHKGDVQTTTMSTPPVKFNQPPSQPLGYVKPMFPVAHDQWTSPKLRNPVTSTSQGVNMDTRFQHPFTAVLAGPTGSGKTEFIKQFLQHIHALVNPNIEEIIFCYGEWQESYQTMKSFPLNLTFVEGLPDSDSLRPGVRKLIIIDDLMAETDERVTRLFTKGSHHKNISVIHILQNLFSKNKEQRCINLNSHYMILFKNPRDSSSIVNLAKQMYPNNVRVMQDAYKEATSQPFSYLLVDLKQNTPEQFRLRGDIFQISRGQTVYVPRK